jgi:hypothetical protein
MNTTQTLTKSARKTLNAQLDARKVELRGCVTAAQISCVLREIERIQAILESGRWPE